MTTKAIRLREARRAARSVVSIRAREGGTRRAARGDTISKRDTKKCVVTTFWAHERKHPRGGKGLFAGISHLGLVRTGFHARQSSFARSRGPARGRVGRFGARGNSDNNAVSESATRGLSTRQESRENSLHTRSNTNGLELFWRFISRGSSLTEGGPIDSLPHSDEKCSLR